MENVIEVKNLIKSYGTIRAVDDISFEVKRGSLFAFLGTNGAGKSTTINMISTFLPPDSGSVSLCGYELGRDNNAIRKKIGVVFQDGLLDDFLTVEENLLCRASLYGFNKKELFSRIENAIRITGLSDLKKRLYGKLSGGQRRRCDIARALVNTPDILFLDEPTTGLDPQTRRDIWNTIKTLQQENNLTVFFSTHYMEEAAAADSVVILDRGKIAVQGTPAQLKDRFAGDKLEFVCDNIPLAEKVLSRDNKIYIVQDDKFSVELKKTIDALPLLTLLGKNILSFEVRSGTMDDAFLSITGKELLK